jgi:sulfur carrier protein
MHHEGTVDGVRSGGDWDQSRRRENRSANKDSQRAFDVSPCYSLVGGVSTCTTSYDDSRLPPLQRPHGYSIESTHVGGYHQAMQVQLSHPERRIEVKGPKRVKELLKELNLIPEAYLVIRGDDLVTEDEMLKDADEIEVRPVISGGAR